MADAVRRLTDAERQRAAVYLASIKTAISGGYSGGLAIKQFIREGLYREDYNTAEEWAEKELGKSLRRVQELIQAAEVVENVKAIEARQVAFDVSEEEEETRQVAPIPLPNTKQAVQLAKLPDPQEQREVWAEVLASEEPVTAKTVAAAVEIRAALRH